MQDLVILRSVIPIPVLESIEMLAVFLCEDSR